VAHRPLLGSFIALCCRAQVVRLAMLSLLAVFRDVLPGYRIRLPTEKELAMPVSKDVKRTRDYEATLLRLYQVHSGTGLLSGVRPCVLMLLHCSTVRESELDMQAYVRQLTKAAAGAESSADGGAATALGQIAMHCMQVGSYDSMS
jgi:hypothetical protein